MDLLEEANAVLWVLVSAMYQTCLLHNAGFKELEDLYGLEYGESIQVFTDFVLSDPPCHGPCSCDAVNSEHDQFSGDNIKSMVELCGEFLKPRDMTIYHARCSRCDSGTRCCQRSMKRSRLCATSNRVCTEGTLG